MAFYISSIYNWLTSYFFPQEEEGGGGGGEPPTTQQQQQQQQQIRKEEHYPKSLHDIHLAIKYLNQASSPNANIPAELVKQILFYANYDCLHYTSFSKRPINAIARSAAGPPARACVVTEPLYRSLRSASSSLSSSSSPATASPTTSSPPSSPPAASPTSSSPSSQPTTNNSIPPKAGRLRSLHLKFTGRDQGWITDPQTTSWSWFEIGKILPPLQQQNNNNNHPPADITIHRGPILAHNIIAGQSWQDFEIYWHLDPLQCWTLPLTGQEGREGEEGQQGQMSSLLREWIADLKGGERIVLVPMAKYGRWQCRVLKAWVDVEVEVWY